MHIRLRGTCIVRVFRYDLKVGRISCSDIVQFHSACLRTEFFHGN